MPRRGNILSDVGVNIRNPRPIWIIQLFQLFQLLNYRNSTFNYFQSQQITVKCWARGDTCQDVLLSLLVKWHCMLVKEGGRPKERKHVHRTGQQQGECKAMLQNGERDGYLETVGALVVDEWITGDSIHAPCLLVLSCSIDCRRLFLACIAFN